jgi:ABC-2 type transport system permease protein
MRAIAIARVSIRRIVRDRTALFFIVVLPVIVILIVGAAERGFTTFRVGVVDLGAGQAGRQLTTAFEHSSDLAVSRYATLAALRKAVARGELNVGVVLPSGMDVTEGRGGTVAVGVMAEQANSSQQAAATAVSSVIAGQGAKVQAARFASVHGSGTFEENLARAGSLQPHVAQVGLRSQTADSSHNVLPEGFSYSAPTMLVFFVFLNALAAGASIIETRQLGMYERMTAGPVRRGTIIAGETLAYFTMALLQATLIVVVGGVAFGVSWGDPLAATVLVALWALVGAGAGMLSGTLFHTPEQASAIGPTAGIALGMLGGCMWPLAIVSSTMRQIGHLTPQAWAVDAWTSLLSRSGTISSIAPQLAVLGAFAALFLVSATVRLRRVVA